MTSKSIAPAAPGGGLAPEASALKFPTDIQPNTAALGQAQRTAALAAATPAKTSKPVMFYQPSMWNIVPEEDGNITATHNSLGDVFKGTPKEFSKMLRDM